MYCFLVYFVLFFFFFKQKTAYEMRISDWSSDVCSSDLRRLARRRGRRGDALRAARPATARAWQPLRRAAGPRGAVGSGGGDRRRRARASRDRPDGARGAGSRRHAGHRRALPRHWRRSVGTDFGAHLSRRNPPCRRGHALVRMAVARAGIRARRNLAKPRKIAISGVVEAAVQRLGASSCRFNDRILWRYCALTTAPAPTLDGGDFWNGRAAGKE